MAAEYAIVENGRVYTEETYAHEISVQMEKLHHFFSRKRDEWVTYRANSGVENRWRRNAQLYYDDQDARMDRFIETLTMGPRPQTKKQPQRSQVVVNIVRPKCDQALARLCEIVLPVDDRNWALKPTPIPEFAERTGVKVPTVDAQGNPTGKTADDEVRELIEEAKRRCERMQRAIDDDLTESRFNSEQRKVLSNGVILGTGILKGPFPRYKEQKAWRQQDNVYQLDFVRKRVFASESVDPWDVYFDPAAGCEVQNGSGVFERVTNVTKKMLRELANTPGYDRGAIAQILDEAPKKVVSAEKRVARTISEDGSYEMWIYTGEIENDSMDLMSGVMYPDKPDALEGVDHGVLVIVNDRVIGAMRSIIPDKSLPYDVWNWRKSDSSPYGYGLPDELAHQQKVINSAWRQVMDNGRYSMGGQIVMRKNKLVPADGQWEITPGKLWYAKDDVADVRHAFQAYEFASHVQELMLVVNAAMQLADSESSMPQILGGQQNGSVPETVGGMIMTFNNAHAVLRYRVKLYDDDVTSPHISRYYDCHMLHGKDEEAKGDFEVDARGSSALIERDLQNQAMINLANITSSPRYAPWMKEKQELEAILKAFKLDPESLMKTQEEYDEFMEKMAQQGPPPDPRILAAQMNMEAKKMELQDRQLQREFEIQRNAEDLRLRQATLMYNADREDKEFTLGNQEAQLKRELAITKMLQDGELTREELLAKERLERIKIADQRERFNAEMYAKMNLGTGI